MGIRISQVPTEYREQLVKNLVQQRGPIGAVRCVEEDTPLAMAFGWDASPEGRQFWDDVDEQRNAEEEKVKLTEFIAEAERRGFANGVNTKHGVIHDKRPGTSEYQEHELLEHEGEYHFFYHNIKVFNSGKWIKPLKPQPATSDEMPEMAAIHALFSDLLRDLRRN